MLTKDLKNINDTLKQIGILQISLREFDDPSNNGSLNRDFYSAIQTSSPGPND
jgi:hypothetical protein